MKKLITILLSVIMVMSMVACGGAEQTVTLTHEENGLSYVYTLKAKGDAVKEINQKTTVDLTQFTSDIIATLDKACEESEELYGELSSATYSVNKTDDKMVETIILDVSNADNIKELADAGTMGLDVENADVVSLAKTIKNLEDMGFTVVE